VKQALKVMNYCSWVSIRAARTGEAVAYDRELLRLSLTRNDGDTGVVDGESVASDLHGLRVMLVPADAQECNG
jgi:hypothetical protein